MTDAALGMPEPLGLIVARAKRDGAIGRDNQLVFRIKEDMQHFKRETMGHPVLMGRKTFESIGKPLPGRTNVVITRNPEFRAEGVTVVHSLEEALDAVKGEAMPYLIGGGDLYAQALPLVTRLRVEVTARPRARTPSSRTRKRSSAWWTRAPARAPT